ncbi:hypothetical protein HKD37_05G013100 [Glycine soja]
MATPPRSPQHSGIPLEATSRRTRQSTRLRRLTVRSLDQPRPMVNVNPAIGRGLDPHKEKFHSYLEEQTMQGSFVLHGHDDILNTTIGRPKHPGHGDWCDNHPEKWRKEVEEENKNLQEAWRRKVEEENKRSLEIIKQELKQAIKLELSQIASHHSPLPPLEAPDIQVLAALVSTKGSYAEVDINPLGKYPSNVHVDTMCLYVVHEQSTRLVALGKVYDNSSTIHNVPYTNDVVRVSIVKVYHEDTQLSFLTSKIQFVRAHWQLVVLCPWDNIVVWFCSLRKKPDVNIKAAINSALKTLTTTLEGKPDQVVPWWIEPKNHFQIGGYECGYYVMHWMWCIVSGDLKNERNRVCLI